MGEIVDLIDKIKRYYKFTPSELKGLVISVLIVAFIISFKDWGPGAAIDMKLGLMNFLSAVLIVTLTFIVRESAHRIAGLSVGFKAEYRMWTFGLLIGIALAFVSNGSIWFLIPGGVVFHHLAGHRLGHFRYGLTYFGTGMVAATAPIANMLLAVFFKVISAFTFNPLIEKIILLNIAFAVFTMLPIPPCDGNKLFFGSRMVYAFVFCSIIAGAFLLLSELSAWVAVIGSLLIGFICWLIYYIVWERKLWGGPFSDWK